MGLARWDWLGIDEDRRGTAVDFVVQDRVLRTRSGFRRRFVGRCWYAAGLVLMMDSRLIDSYMHATIHIVLYCACACPRKCNHYGPARQRLFVRPHMPAIATCHLPCMLPPMYIHITYYIQTPYTTVSCTPCALSQLKHTCAYRCPHATHVPHPHIVQLH